MSKNLNIFDREIERVDIVFENCEVYSVPADCIQYMSINDIKMSMVLHFNGLSEYTKPGETSNFTSCSSASIVLNKNGFEIHSSWDCVDDTLADRIKSKDITHFDLIFKDGTNLYVSVPWEDGISEFDNSLQENIFRDDTICIYIDPNVEKECNIQNEVQDDDKYNYGVPEYVNAALNLIEAELDRVMWNINQKVYDNPFQNSSNQFKCDIFEVESYDWNEESNQEYNFKWKDYYIKWYKYVGRGMESNREITPDECAIMLNECLKAIRELDVDEDDLFDNEESEENKCIQCGEETDYKQLNSGVWACKECLDKIGKEQKMVAEELEDLLGEWNFDYKETYNFINDLCDFINFVQNNTTVTTIDHLLNSLKASGLSIAYKNNVLDDEEKNNIENEMKKWLDK